jgi:hypothetical protein
MAPKIEDIEIHHVYDIYPIFAYVVYIHLIALSNDKIMSESRTFTQIPSLVAHKNDTHNNKQQTTTTSSIITTTTTMNTPSQSLLAGSTSKRARHKETER